MNNENLMTKFYEAEVQSVYSAEKQKNNAVQVRDDDIIQRNIGGKKMTTTRSTLCQVEGSLLASMFSGRWEHGLARDQKGCVFFDFNPKIFVLILDYLRAKKIASPENPAPLPRVPVDQVKNFSNLVEYLGLSDEIIPSSRLVSNEIFNSRSKGVTLEEGGKIAVHCPSSGNQYVLGENVYQLDIVRLKLKLEYFHGNSWMFVGIVKGDVSPQNNHSYFWSGSYGWSLGNTGQVYRNGSQTIDNTLKNLSKQGDTVELLLDCDAGNLSLCFSSGQKFHIDIPRLQAWRLNVGLYTANGKIRIVDE